MYTLKRGNSIFKKGWPTLHPSAKYGMHFERKKKMTKQQYVNPKQTMGGLNQDAAYSAASPCQMNKV